MSATTNGNDGEEIEPLLAGLSGARKPAQGWPNRVRIVITVVVVGLLIWLVIHQSY